jgi:2-oxoglutarate dehydrogenase E2 component (dihydrolipoamide succinyltransferase)
MPIIEMVMPKMGESVMEGTILKWLKKVGDKIEQDEPVLEVATDKVDTEIPATHAGILTQILAQEGEVVAIGKVIAMIDTANGSTPASPSSTENSIQQNLSQIEQTIAVATQVASRIVSNDTAKVENDNRFYSPLVLNIAKKEGISMTELANIQGTGMENRVTKKDIFKYLETRKTNTIPTTTNIQPITTHIPTQSTSVPTENKTMPSAQVATGVSYSGAADIIEMDRMRKMIAQRMVESKQISAHVTTFVEVDVTNIVLWRNKIKENFKKKQGENITFTPIFIEAIAKALRDFPTVNSSVEGDKIIIKKDINIGMAAALPTGNLIVPVIKNADQMNLLGLTKKVNDLANRARTNKLQPDELTGGTYSMSNIGSFGNEMGTPIIMQPQVAILAFGAIKKKPAVIETPTGDMIAIRHLMFISHSYDHRIIDGALGGMFARKVADYLEAFDINREI